MRRSSARRHRFASARRHRRSLHLPAPRHGPGRGGKIGAFYETKNVTIGKGSKLSHLGYAGDAEIGEYTNIGCGNITANYDGVNKHRTVIGSHVRTGSNTVFVAPVTVGDGAYSGAGAVDPQGRPGRRAGPLRGPAAQHRGLGRGQPARHRSAAWPAAAAETAAPSGPAPNPPLLRHREKRAINHERNTAHGDKKLVLASGRAHPELAEEIAKELGTELLPTLRLRLRQRRDLRALRRERARLRRLRDPVAHVADEQLAHGAADHDRCAEARLGQAHHRGRPVLPLRPAGQEGPRPRADLGPPGRRPVQDRRRRPHDGVDLHTAQIQGFFDGPVDHLLAIPLLPDYIAARSTRQRHGRLPGHRPRPRGRQWTESLGGVPLAFVHKRRDLTVPNQAVSKTVVGQIEGRTCVLIDDMIDTGGTISGAVQVLKDAGAKDVIIAATHAVFSDPAAQPPDRVRCPRGRGHQHAADPGDKRFTAADGAVDRTADRPRDPGGVRGRLGDEPVRRPAPEGIPAGGRPG